MSNSSENIIKKYVEHGICYPHMTLNIRSVPCATTGEILDQYHEGESVIYDYIVITDKYVWISWTSSGSGKRVYMAVKNQSTGERFALCTDIPIGSGGNQGSETITNEYPEDGMCYPNRTINIRSTPCATTGVILDQYSEGESVIYDYVIITNKYVWISWISSGGKRVYMATKDQSTGERFALCTDIPGGSGGSGGSEVRVKEYSETGICYPNMTLNIRSMPCAITGEILDQYYDGESVIYDYVVITDKYVWISWTSGGSGRRVYMAVKDQSTGERFALCTDIPGSGSGGAAGGSSMPGVRKVFIDPGHGGNDPGAIGNGLKENEVVLNIANKLGTLLTNSGISVKYSRRNNNYVELSERARQANEWGADLFVSIHANAFNGSAYGTECYTHPTDSLATKQLSANVANIISSKLGLYNRGHKEADFAVLRLTSMPAILVETAFIDNSRDANLLKQKESEFASAIYTAITGLSIGNENQSVDPSDLFKGELFQQLLRDSWMFNGIGLEFTPDELTAKSNTVITSHFPLVSVHGELSLSAQVFDGETISFGHDFNSSSLAQSYVGKYIATDLSINFAEKELTKLFDEIGVSIPFGTHITVKTQLVNLTTIKIIMESKVDTSNLPELYQRINMYSRIVISITNNSPLGRLYIPIGAYEKHEVDDGVGLNWEAIRGIALVAVGTAITIGCVALAIGSAGSSVPATVIGLLAISGTKYNPEN